MNPITISIKEAAATLSLGRTSIYSLINQGKIDTIKFGRRTLVKVDSIHRFIKERGDA